MSKKQEMIWVAKPHTVAKLQILSAYLKDYFPILGTNRSGQEILIIDGFAGPDEYINHSHGSPSAALSAATGTLAGLGSKWKAGRIHIAFIERNRKRFGHLKNRIDEKSNSLPTGIVTHLYNATFEKGLEQIRRDIPQPFNSNCPLFVFIDPFGAKGAPFSVVAELLQSPCSEVLLNLDADGISRILKAGEHAKHELNLTAIFGDESWREKITAIDSAEQCRQIRELYLEQLRNLPNIKYVYSFAMHTTGKSVNYYLVFASQHHRGLEKMKVAMKRMGQDNAFTFADDRHRSGQYKMMFFDDPDTYAPIMHEHFTGQRITYATARDFALNYSPYINPKKCLEWLDRKDLLNVDSSNPKRRKGTFVEDDITAITFLPGIL